MTPSSQEMEPPGIPERFIAWGANNWGQCDVPEPNAGFVAVAAGGTAAGFLGDLSGHSLGLKADSSVVAWGDNRYGQRNVPEPNTGFVAIDAGGSQHTFGSRHGILVAEIAIDAVGVVGTQPVLETDGHHGTTGAAAKRGKQSQHNKQPARSCGLCWLWKQSRAHGPHRDAFR